MRRGHPSATLLVAPFSGGRSCERGDFCNEARRLPGALGASPGHAARDGGGRWVPGTRGVAPALPAGPRWLSHGPWMQGALGHRGAGPVPGGPIETEPMLPDTARPAVPAPWSPATSLKSQLSTTSPAWGGAGGGTGQLWEKDGHGGGCWLRNSVSVPPPLGGSSRPAWLCGDSGALVKFSPAYLTFLLRRGDRTATLPLQDQSQGSANAPAPRLAAVCHVVSTLEGAAWGDPPHPPRPVREAPGDRRPVPSPTPGPTLQAWPWASWP